MNIIGFSGLNEAVAFKRRTWHGLEEREYRIVQGHDAAAAFVSNGRIIAAGAEERFNRKKHSELFPVSAIQFCLNYAGVSISDIDQLVHCFDYQPHRLSFLRTRQQSDVYWEVYSRAAILKGIVEHLPDFPVARVHHIPHHLAHAASAYYTSGWPQCAVLVIDAMGEVDSVSGYRGCDGKLLPLFRVRARDSIGILYSLITLHLGFDFNSDEYKIMGLAPYGDPSRFRGFFEEHVLFGPKGVISIPMLSIPSNLSDLETYAHVRRYLGQKLITGRHPDAEICQEHCDVAAALQECLDRAVQFFAAELARQTGFRRLVMAGGVALNCTANGRLLHSGVFDEIYIQPAAGDDGAAVGAALYQAAVAGELENQRMPVPFLGPAFSDDEISHTLRSYAGRVKRRRFRNLEETCEEAALQIAQGKVIGWFRGRMEFGPRALGNRSILADARNPEMRDRVNAMVKKRESFRPFAPAVSCEQAARIFDIPENMELPYMVVIVNVREKFRACFPAITHVDGTARVQTVSANDNSDFHTLLRHVGNLTGFEIVLNTSFNVKGQPIVNTPKEAIDTFVAANMDSLILGNSVVTL